MTAISVSTQALVVPQQNVASVINHVDHVPKELWKKICFYLDSTKDVVHLALTSRFPYFLISDGKLWKFFLEKHFSGLYTNLKSEVDSPFFYKRLTIAGNNIKAGKYRFQTLAGSKMGTIETVIYNGMLISRTNNGLIEILDFESGKKRRTLEHHGLIDCMTVCDGKLCTGSSGLNDRTIKTWDIESGQELQMLDAHHPFTRILPYGDKLIFGASGTPNGMITIWDLKSGQEPQTFGHGNFITCMQIYGDKLFSGTWDGMIKILDIESGQELRTLDTHRSPISAIAVCNGEIISGSLDGTIKIWELENGTFQLLTLKEPQRPITRIAAYNDSISGIAAYHDSIIISASWDGTIKIWNLKKRQLLQTLAQPSWGTSMEVCNGKIIAAYGNTITTSGVDHTIKIWDFNFPSLSPYSQDILEENLMILGKMAHAEYIGQPEDVQKLAEQLYSDFKERLKQHSFKVGASFTCSAAVILRVQTEVCLEALLNAIHSEDHSKVSELLKQLIWIDRHQNTKIYELLWETCGKPDYYRWGEFAFHNEEGCSATPLQKEMATVAFKQVLKDRWGEDLPLLLLNLGIVTKKDYLEKLGCAPDFLPLIGIRSSDDLQVIFNSSHLQHLQIIPEEVTKDRTELQKRGFDKKEIVFECLNGLISAAQQKSTEAKQYAVRRDEGGNVYEASNPWIAFQEKLYSYQVALDAQCLSPQELIKTFSPQAYAKIVEEVNTMIDEFLILEKEHRIIRLHSYTSQWGLLKVWTRLNNEKDIDSLAVLSKKEGIAPKDIFSMGE